jgi:hypothetical protein
MTANPDTQRKLAMARITAKDGIPCHRQHRIAQKSLDLCINKRRQLIILHNMAKKEKTGKDNLLYEYEISDGWDDVKNMMLAAIRFGSDEGATWRRTRRHST